MPEHSEFMLNVSTLNNIAGNTMNLFFHLYLSIVCVYMCEGQKATPGRQWCSLSITWDPDSELRCPDLVSGIFPNE